MSKHEENALQTLERMTTLVKSIHTLIENGERFYYWEPMVLELVNAIQALRLNCEMIFREQTHD